MAKRTKKPRKAQSADSADGAADPAVVVEEFFDALQDQLHDQTNLDDSLVTLISGVGKVLTAASADPKKIQAIGEFLETNAKDLAESAQANTAHAPATQAIGTIDAPRRGHQNMPAKAKGDDTESSASGAGADTTTDETKS